VRWRVVERSTMRSRTSGATLSRSAVAAARMALDASPVTMLTPYPPACPRRRPCKAWGVTNTEVPASHVDLLDKPMFAHLATVRPDGSPQTQVMWFVWDGERIRMTHTMTRQKYRNFQREPRVALSIADPANRTGSWRSAAPSRRSTTTMPRRRSTSRCSSGTGELPDPGPRRTGHPLDPPGQGHRARPAEPAHRRHTTFASTPDNRPRDRTTPATETAPWLLALAWPPGTVFLCCLSQADT
jgi:hypothetical protein